MNDEQQRQPTIGPSEWLIIAAAALLLWCGSCRFAHADTPAEILDRIDDDVRLLRAELEKPTPLPDPEPHPTPIITDIGTVLLQPLFHADNQRKPPEGSRRITEAELRSPGIDGMTIRIIPQFLSVDGRWDFRFVDECVALCRKTGDRYTLLLAGGGADPLAEKSLAFYEAAAKALGERYASDPSCRGVHVTGAEDVGHSEEYFWGRPMPPAAMTAIKRMIVAWSNAFPRQVILFAGTANDVAASREIIAYGNQVAPGRFLYKINALSAKMAMPDQWASTQLVVDAGQAGSLIGFEMLDNSSAQRFGGTFDQSLAKLAEIERLAGKSVSYLAIYRGDIAKAAQLR